MQINMLYNMCQIIILIRGQFIVKNILITGAGGFLGRALLTRLAECDDIKVTALTSKKEKLKNINNSNMSVITIEEIKNTFSSTYFDYFIHAAFPRNALGNEMASGLKYYCDMLKLATENNVGSIINISSQSVYDSKRRYAAHELSPLSLDSCYAVGKYATELMIDNIANNIPKTNIRMSSLIGPEFDQRITNQFVLKVLQGEEITIHGGKQIFSFLDVRDAANGILKLLATSPADWDSIYNLGSNHSYTLYEIAKKTQATASTFGLAPTNLKVIEGDLWSNSSLDSNKFGHQFKYTPQFTLEDSLKSIFIYKMSQNPRSN